MNNHHPLWWKECLLCVFVVLVTSQVAVSQNVDTVKHRIIDFIHELDDDQLTVAVRDFEDPERLKWTNLPVGMVPRPGVRYGDLSDDARIGFHRLLTTLLSSQGYLKLTSIMQLDDVLNELVRVAYEEGKFDEVTLARIQGLNWAYENFFVTVWGNPVQDELWGLAFGGHHVALNVTANGDRISTTPLFFGSDPAEVKSGKYAGWRVLSEEEDIGFAMLWSLSERQLETVVIDTVVPRDIITNPSSSQRLDEYQGLSAHEMTDLQIALLKSLIREYVANLDRSSAHLLMDKITQKGMDDIYFGWIGSQSPGEPHYYVVNGPDFLIEYDNYPNQGNHIHMILREKENDFGEDILKAHYEQSGHHKKDD